jgi:4-amino-4-deoxy-L-arabinose transferase-like glycosyltransferase
MKVNVSNSRILVPVISAGALVLLVAPTVWAAISINQKTPQAIAGPSQTRGGFGGNLMNQASTANPALIRYLENNQGNAKFLVATASSMTADGIILATNKPVMAMGGFMGNDPILTTSSLQTLIKNGTVRFFLLNAPGNRLQLPPQFLAQIPQQFRNRIQQGGFGGFGGFGGGRQSTLTTWVTQHCTTVPTSQWQSTSTSSSAGLRGPNQLYDCAKAK